MSLLKASTVAPSGDGRYTSEIHQGWDIFGVTNGGYLMATTARAMGGQAGGRTLASVSARFLNPATPGPAEIDVETLKEGRSTSTLQAMMVGGGRTLLTTSATFVEPGEGWAEVTMSHGSPPDLPPPERCIRLIPGDDAPLPPPFTSKVEVYLHPEDASLGTGRPGEMPEVRGWFRLLDEEPIDAYGLVVAADAFPPAVFNSGLPLGWTPTVDLTVHVRDPGPHHWVACRFYTRFVTGGWLEEDGEIWDTSGRLVAQSRQLALVAR